MTISCENVTCMRGEAVVLQGIGFSLQPAGFLLLKGANGSGKTSLIRILAGLSQPAAGRVLWRGEPIQGNADFKKELTYIGHLNAIKTECTVEENVRFWANVYGTQLMYLPTMRFFNLEDKADVPCHELSAGWQRRVALSRLLLSPTSLWLLDEPTNFLDAEAVALLTSLIETRVKHDGTVIVASHTLASGMAAHVLKLEDFAPGHSAGRESGSAESGSTDRDPAPTLRAAQDDGWSP